MPTAPSPGRASRTPRPRRRSRSRYPSAVRVCRAHRPAGFARRAERGPRRVSCGASPMCAATDGERRCRLGTTGSGAPNRRRTCGGCCRAVQALERRTTTITDGEWSGHVRSPGSGWARRAGRVAIGARRRASGNGRRGPRIRCSGRSSHSRATAARSGRRGDPRGQFDRLVEPVDDLDPVDTTEHGRQRRTGVARWRSRRRPGRARPPSATGRHPCRSRRRSARCPRKLRIAADAACGVVALESLYHATPSMSARCSKRCVRPDEAGQRRCDRIVADEPRLDHQGRRGQAFVMSCGSARRIAADRRPTSRADR